MSSRFERVARVLWLGALCSAPWTLCQAALPRYCDTTDTLTASQRDQLLRFAAAIKSELERSGASVALIARSGLDLDRFGQRYSHEGISLKASPNTPWSVRQLYYACDERRPRLFDQGLAGFLFGTDKPDLGYVSVVLLPPADAAALETVALDKPRALQLLNATYSANAYAWSLKYQNCNQWVIELLASAWNDTPDAGEPVTDNADPTDRTDPTDPTDTSLARARAQRWLAQQGYAPTRIVVDNRALVWAGAFVPWLHDDDHPPEDRAALTYRISMPASIERFVRTRDPAAERIEFCHTDTRLVVHRGWEPIADGCTPGAQDSVSSLVD